VAVRALDQQARLVPGPGRGKASRRGPYGEERSLLIALRERIAEHPVLVTFNGKSFDWRATRNPLSHDPQLFGADSASPHRRI